MNFRLLLVSALLPAAASAQVNISGPLSDATTGPLLAGTVYHATSNISVSLGATLTVQPGAIVKFAGASLTFDVAGTLTCQGTPGNPVIFTDVKDDTAGGDTNGDGVSVGVPGHWIYLRMYASSNASVLDHTEIRYAGGFGWAGLTLTASAPTLRDCAIRDCLNAGVDLAGKSLAVIERTHFADNGGAAVMAVQFEELPGFSQCTASGNAGGDYQQITGVGTAANIAVVPDDLINGVGVCTLTPTLSAGQTLTFGAGSIFKMGTAGNTWELNGSLICQGTPAAPVIITDIKDDSAGGDTNADGPSTGTPGQWTYMRFYVSSSASVLDHVQVRYAGAFGWAGITISGGSPTLRDCIIRDCLNDGLSLNVLNGIPIVQRCQFLDNGGPAVSNARFGDVTGFSQCTASGNAGGDFQAFVGQTVVGDVVVQADNLINGLGVMTAGMSIMPGNSLTLGSGVVLKMSVPLLWDIRGGFTTQGSADLPVVLTSFGDDSYGGDTNLNGASTGTPGSWLGLWLQGGGTTIDHLLVRYAGGNGFSSVIHYAAASYVLSDSRTEFSASNGFELNNHSGTARGMTAWKCAGTGVALKGGSFDLRQSTAVACGTGISRTAGFTGRVEDSIAVSNVTANTSNFIAGQWRFSNGLPGLAGIDGNISALPLFFDEIAGDFRLHHGSPCVNTGDPLSPLDPDGTRADMGAYETDQTNPIAYCVGKLNSCGSMPTIGWSGSMHAGATSGFVLSATNTKALSPGLLLYGSTGASSINFGGSVLCIQAPVRRSVGMVDTSGTAGQCNGVLSLDLATFATGGLGGNPAPFLQFAGSPVWCQFWGRDSGLSEPMLSNAATFLIRP